MKLWLPRALVLISAIRTPWDRMPIASAASKQALDPKAEQSIPPLKIMEGAARDWREPLITLQLTPSAKPRLQRPPSGGLLFRAARSA
jgi:hypothetical protein